MDIFDSIKSGADRAAKKAGDYSDIAKLTLKIKNEKSKLKVMLYELGAEIYNAIDDDAEAEIKAKLYPKIAEKRAYIGNLVSTLEAKNGTVRCKICNAKIRPSMAFCPACGAKQHGEPPKPTEFVDITEEYFANKSNLEGENSNEENKH